MNLVNIVATGSINHELDLKTVHKDIQSHDQTSESKLSKFNLNMGFTEADGSLLLYRSGKYNIMGCSSVDEVEIINQLFLDTLSDLGIMIQSGSSNISISNYVYTIDLNQDIDLNKIYFELNGNVQYEPEQNPFVIYKPDEINGMITISNSGKCVVNTSEGRDTVVKIKRQIRKYLN